MIVVCTACASKFKVADEKVGTKGVKVRCSKCQTIFVVRPDGATEPVPPKKAAAAPAPLPPPEPVTVPGVAYPPPPARARTLVGMPAPPPLPMSIAAAPGVAEPPPAMPGPAAAAAARAADLADLALPFDDFPAPSSAPAPRASAVLGSAAGTAPATISDPFASAPPPDAPPERSTAPIRPPPRPKAAVAFDVDLAFDDLPPPPSPFGPPPNHAAEPVAAAAPGSADPFAALAGIPGFGPAPGAPGAPLADVPALSPPGNADPFAAAAAASPHRSHEAATDLSGFGGGPPTAAAPSPLGDPFAGTAPPAGPPPGSMPLDDPFAGLAAAAPPLPDPLAGPPAPLSSDPFAGMPLPELQASTGAKALASIPDPIGDAERALKDPFTPAAPGDFDFNNIDAFGSNEGDLAGPDPNEGAPAPPPPAPQPSLPPPGLSDSQPVARIQPVPAAAVAEEPPPIPKPSGARWKGIATSALSITALLLVALAILVTWRNGWKLDPSLFTPGGVAAALSGRAGADAERTFVATVAANGLYDTEKGAPLLYLRGRVVSRAKEDVGAVRVVVELVEDGKVVGKSESMAGGVATPEELYAVGKPAELGPMLEKAAARAPDKVKPGEGLPFLVAFAEYPADLSRVTFRVSAEAGTKTASR